MPHRCLIVGATSGLADAILELLSKDNQTSVLAVGRTPSKLKYLRNRYSNIESVHEVDFDAEDSIAAAQESLSDEHTQSIRSIVLIPPRIPSTTSALPSGTDWHLYLQRCFIGPLELISPIVSADRDSDLRMVVISGISSVQALSDYAMNNAIRAAWLAQAKTLSLCFGPQGLRVNTLSLGGTLTPAYDGKIRAKATKAGRSFDEQMEEEVSNVPLRKYANPKEVAKLVAFFIEDGADHITGQNILVDGGFVKSY